MSLKRSISLFITKVLLLGCTLAPTAAAADSGTASLPLPALPERDAAALYRDLLNPVFNPSDVYHVRDVSIDREDLHVSFSDGTIALMRSIDGHVTGAVFEGTGEVLLFPPNRAERVSMALFTGSGVLEQSFASAYFRFFDDKLVGELRAGFRAEESAEEFIGRWEQAAKILARGDALQILRAMINAQDPASRFIHFKLGGTQLGVFDVLFDANAQEQIVVAQERLNAGTPYLDTWVSFPMRSVRENLEKSAASASLPRLEVSDYRLKVRIQPPTEISAEGEVTLTPRRAGQRAVMLELSQYLRLSDVRVDGQKVEFIQNEAATGSELARRGNDLIAIVFPAALEKDRPVRISFSYSGPVMFNAGGELLYVGARGTWYPNTGPSFANYDLTFDYPEDWSLVATGKAVSSTLEISRRSSRFVTEKPIARAGFNLGKFESAAASAGSVAIHAYAGKNVEKELAANVARAGRNPQPAREVRQIAEQAAASIKFLSAGLEPFPYSDLEITQIPGLVSQSWPGLIYLSSMAFLDREDRRALGLRDPYVELLLSRLMLSHETAHQWWGDAVDWISYRDEWIIEALANYCALLMLEKEDPQSMKITLDYYKSQLLRETGSGIMSDAGPVTLGVRLTSSKFPQAYERVLYGRGTWLIHMLRTMLRQAGGKDNDELFFAALKSLLANSPNHKISTRELQRAFEQVLPDSLSYEGRKSLDWFFDTWVNDAAIPQFSLQDVRVVAAGGQVKVSGTIEESHATKDLVTAIPLYAVNEAGKQQFLSLVFADEAKTQFTLTAPAGTKQLLLDPEGTLLRR
jgi:Peptidase family M1 domain